MITFNDLCKIGKIVRPHGIAGEVELLFTLDVFDDDMADYFFLDMDGLPVPFFWEEYRFKNSESAIIKWRHYDTDAAAKALVGHDVYYAKTKLSHEENNIGILTSWKALEGFSVFDEQKRILGEVNYVDDSTKNVILSLTDTNGNNLLLPLHEDFIISLQLNERQLYLQLPEGLLDIN